MDHPYGKPGDCEWRGIIIRVIYIFSKLDIACPLIPDTVDVTDINQFKDWLSKEPGDFPGFPLHNGLNLFLWIAYEYLPLFDVPT